MTLWTNGDKPTLSHCNALRDRFATVEDFSPYYQEFESRAALQIGTVAITTNLILMSPECFGILSSVSSCFLIRLLILPVH
jgi:hypothetical protein